MLTDNCFWLCGGGLRDEALALSLPNFFADGLTLKASCIERRPRKDAEIMTIEEAATFLEMEPRLGSIHSKAKRVRRSDLMAWIDQLAARSAQPVNGKGRQ